MRIERELMRGVGPTAVLKLLQRSQMYGYQLVDALATRSQGVLQMGQSTLYPLLYNLEAKGLIASEWRDAASGRQRRYYRLTPKGEKHLGEQSKQWRAVAQAMQALGVLGDGAAGLGVSA